jgi:hypothetical protein
MLILSINDAITVTYQLHISQLQMLIQSITSLIDSINICNYDICNWYITVMMASLIDSINICNCDICNWYITVMASLITVTNVNTINQWCHHCDISVTYITVTNVNTINQWCHHHCDISVTYITVTNVNTINWWHHWLIVLTFVTMIYVTDISQWWHHWLIVLTVVTVIYVTDISQLMPSLWYISYIYHSYKC